MSKTFAQRNNLSTAKDAPQEPKAFLLKTQEGEYVCWLSERTAQKIQREHHLNLRLLKPKLVLGSLAQGVSSGAV